MTPREVMTRAIEFRRPARLAISGYGELSDGDGVGYEQPKPPQAGDDETLDQWLCRWGKTDQPNMGQVKGHPLEDLAAMKDFPWPDGADPKRYEVTGRQLDELYADPKRKDKYVTVGIFMLLWERMHALHGFENCMVDLMDDSPAIHELADRVVAYDIDVVRSVHRVAGDRVQGFGFSEDWGTQIDVHLSPELWERFFLPRYKKIFGAIHECGWHVLMHSCGRINKYLPGLIEAGVDRINMQQPRANGIEEVGREFAGRICFESLCDIQKTLPRGSKSEIDAEAEALLRRWGRPEGGFVLGDYGDHAAIGASPETKQYMVQRFQSLDPWKAGAPKEFWD